MTKPQAHELLLLHQRDRTPVGSRSDPPYFFGVYTGLQETDNDPFATEGYISYCQAMIDSWSSPPARIRDLLRKLLGRKPPIRRHLAPIVSRLRERARTQTSVRVIDVGGGYGDNYHDIARALGRLADRVQYTVVDNPIQCELGRTYHTRKGIDFVSEMPRARFDIAVVVGVLQLLQDWKAFVSELTTCVEDSIFVSRAPFSLDSPTFVTVQSICPPLGSHAGRKLGESNVWVINEAELNRCFYDHAFRLETSAFALDYSANFARVPERHRDVAYIDKHYVRQTSE